MARPSKRRAEGDPEIESPENRSSSHDPSSTPPSDPRKRRRISDDSIQDHDGTDREDTPPSDYDSVSDPDQDENEEDDEDEEELATQAIRQKRAEQTQNSPPDCGILESVNLFNFMCHKKYEFKLGPLINFICGANGSGKSAILTAIVLCLGGKASATNRGGSLKTFIKEGEDSARIVCRIKNQGEDAFMPEEYGDSIEVERHFSKNGTSGFKLRSATGRMISTKKADLDEICDHFALQIDNPLNVLSQDMARQFISTSNAAEKYRFFVKGVQLEQLDQDYRLIEEQLENIKVTIENKRPDIVDLERDMEKAQAKDNAMRKKENTRLKLRDLRRQIAWVQVREQENLLADYDKEIQDADNGIREAESQLVTLEESFQACEEADRLSKDAFERAKATLLEAQEVKREAEAGRDAKKKVLADAGAELRNIRDELKVVNRNADKAVSDIESEENRLLELQGPGPAQRLRDLEDSRNQMTESRKEFEDNRIQMQNAIEHQRDLERLLGDKAKEADERRATEKRREHELQDFLANHDQLDAAYHPKMRHLLHAIEQEKRFKERPIGPMGKHIRLLREEWSSIIESAIGKNLSGFIVTSRGDNDILKQIMARVGAVNVPVIIGNKHALDTSNLEPDEHFDTVLRVLEIDNDHVRKQLVIQHAVEQTILIRDVHEATDTMLNQRLRNVKRCYCIHPHNKRQGISLSYTRENTVNHDPIREFAGKPRMKGDNLAQTRIRQEALSDAKKERHESEQAHYKARDELVRQQQAIKRQERRDAELKIAYQTLQDKVERLEDAIQEDNVEGGRLDVLRTTLQELRTKKEFTESTYKDAVNATDGKKAELSEAQRKLNVADTELMAVQNDHAGAQQTAARSDKERAFNLGRVNEAAARVEDAKNDRAKMDEMRVDKEQKVADFVNQASVISGRVNIPDNETQETLTARYKVLETDMTKFRRQMGGDEKDIAEAAQAAREAFRKGRKDLENLENINKKLTESLIERQQRWKLFRSHISVRAKAMFTYLLSERSFRGKLVTDHKQKLLKLSVEPDITKRDGRGRDAQTLSGGEKSFSQICLLLSIWEAMGSPIRCLDEFDVFMDAVNRRLSVNLLIEGARQSFGRQFILISPGTKSDIQKADDINGVEVQKPLRGQRTLAETGIQRDV